MTSSSFDTDFETCDIPNENSQIPIPNLIEGSESSQIPIIKQDPISFRLYVKSNYPNEMISQYGTYSTKMQTKKMLIW